MIKIRLHQTFRNNVRLHQTFRNNGITKNELQTYSITSIDKLHKESGIPESIVKMEVSGPQHTSLKHG